MLRWELEDTTLTMNTTENTTTRTILDSIGIVTFDQGGSSLLGELYQKNNN